MTFEQWLWLTPIEEIIALVVLLILLVIYITGVRNDT